MPPTLFTLTPSLLNPWDLSVTHWFAGYAVARAVLLLAVEGLVFLSARVLPKLPTRTGPKPPYVHPLSFFDVLFLLINSFIEFVFVNQISWMLWYSPLASSSSQPHASRALPPACAAEPQRDPRPQVLRVAPSLSLLNGPAAFWLLLVADDMLYAPAHRLMHWKPVYKCAAAWQLRAGFAHTRPSADPGRFVHKHHHRNTYPSRGYFDGANEHPLEQALEPRAPVACAARADAGACARR